MIRKKTKIVHIGDIAIGGDNKIAIQSMTNTKTKDIVATVKQIKELEAAGCEIIRVAVLDTEDAKAIKKIKEQIKIPLVADIHFDYKLALLAIENGVDKIRINPGNIGSVDRIRMIVEACQEKNIPIRIGINSGSLEKDILEKHGKVTASALVESALRSVRILEYLHFYDIVVSIKASDVAMAVEAYEKASIAFDYPLHIGITEAGSKTSGTIKSSICLGILLNEGIGDTIRVSLSAPPLEEVKVAKEILASFGLYKKPILISCPTCGRTQYNMFKVVDEIEAFLEQLGNVEIRVAIMGCVVNGPGEAREADIGIAGGINEALLFKKGEIIRKIPEDKIVEELKKEIIDMIKQK
ncbi:MAG: flavodoxin-dependent (E)-4-hydroxy-3-methylbut-2-enyl-diphosphate synthase [Candidatus Izemoplasmatales bacterium]|nr:flavodoxin-dependent (E)-4-hydroxy-3-methylbut-2-enyl-diphosphate synthase [Candidatus Izemoplasmatales bacterium]